MDGPAATGTLTPSRRPAGDAPRERALTRRLGLDPVELLALLALIAISVAPLLALLTKGRPLSGADGFLATDQMQYLAWIREASHHVLITNPWDLAPGRRVFLHPLVLISGALHALLGISVPLAYLLWKPVAVAMIFCGSLAYARRLVSAGGARHAALALALFAVMPASALVAWSGWGGGPREYSFDFISGEMWTGQYLWGYLFTAIAVFALPLVLLGAERWRAAPSRRLLARLAAATLLIAWLQPWQGMELLVIVWAVELLRWGRRREGPEPARALLAALSAAVALPGAYYLALSHYDAAWKLAGSANKAGAQPLWSWPWWAVLLTLAPLALPAAIAYRRPLAELDWQQLALRVWPLAVLLVYLQPFGTFPYHAFQGLQLPLAILAVLGVRAWRPALRPAAGLLAVALLVVPGTLHKAGIFRNSVHTAGDPYWVFPGEVDALKALERDRRPGGVLAPTYASLLVPSRSGREAYVGPFSWTPDWTARALAVNALFEGRLRGAPARRFVVGSRARWLLADCRPLALARLELTLRPLLARAPRHFGCATVYELRLRPEMARAAGPPDS